MRVISAVGFFSLLATSSLVAQRATLNPFVTYNWGGSVRVFEGDLRLAASEAYGVTLDVAVRPGAKAQLFYSYQPTQLNLRRFNGLTEPITPMKVHYIHLGGTAESGRGRMKGFGGASAGATIFHASDPRFSDEWRFSVRLFLGGKMMFSERVGLHVKGEVLLPIQWVGVCFGCGGTGATAGTTIVQGVVGGGLTIAF